MSIEKDLKSIKEQISAEEQFLENFIKSERVFKKYKKSFIGVCVTVICAGIFYSANDYFHEENLKKTNAAFIIFLKNNDNNSSLESIKKNNPKLYEAYTFSSIMSKNDPKQIEDFIKNANDPILKSIAEFKANQNSEMLNDVRNLQLGFEFLKQNKIKQAKEKFALISIDSPLQDIVRQLEHFQGVKK